MLGFVMMIKEVKNHEKIEVDTTFVHIFTVIEAEKQEDPAEFDIDINA